MSKSELKRKIAHYDALIKEQNRIISEARELSHGYGQQKLGHQMDLASLISPFKKGDVVRLSEGKGYGSARKNLYHVDHHMIGGAWRGDSVFVWGRRVKKNGDPESRDPKRLWPIEDMELAGEMA